MKLEYCYDKQRDLYWLVQIQLVSDRLVFLHYVGLPDNDTSCDFWADIYGQQCHPVGWCKEKSKLLIPPPIVTKRAIQHASMNYSNGSNINNSDKQTPGNRVDGGESLTPPQHIFDQVNKRIKFISITNIDKFLSIFSSI